VTEQEPDNAPAGGKKFDKGKPRYDLIPPAVLKELAILYGIGAEKYGDRNWEEGIHYTRVARALMSHLFLFLMGETRDPVDGQHHADSMIWNSIALRHMELHPDKYHSFDDRPNYDPEYVVTEAGEAALAEHKEKDTHNEDNQ
jgi:hypothetical protein